MYIMKCDRCGKEQPIKTLIAFFGGEGDPRAALKYSITLREDGGVREITLCQDCEEWLDRWFSPGGYETRSCETCRHANLSVQMEPCASCNTVMHSMWQPKENEEEEKC